MMDPHCRTRAGFQSLVQKEWVVGGHCFLDRCNHLRQSDKEEVSVRGALVPVGAGCCARARAGPLRGRLCVARRVVTLKAFPEERGVDVSER